MFKYLMKLIRTMQGNVLTIGVDDRLLTCFGKNNRVNVYTLERDKGFFSKSKKRRDNSGKTINIKKLRKYFNKKSLDYIICDYEEISNYLKYVVRDIVMINCGKLYLYCNSCENIELITGKFTRYGATVNEIRFKDRIILEIDNHNSKTTWLKNKGYYLIDTISNFGEFIGNLLVS